MAMKNVLLQTKYLNANHNANKKSLDKFLKSLLVHISPKLNKS